MNPVRSIRNRYDARKRSLLIGRAIAARDIKQWREAAAHYRESLDLFPSDPDIWVQFGHMLKEAGSLDEAEAAYRKALSQRPDFSDTHLMLGHALKMKGKLPEALSAYCRAVELDPSDPRPREEVDRLSAQLNAQPAPKVASKPSPEAAREAANDALRLAGDRARDSGDWSEAAKIYKQYLAVRKSDADIWVQYGHALKERGYFDEADTAYAMAEQITPNVPDTYLHHGHLLKVMGRTDDAIKAFRRVAALDPANTEGAREAAALEHKTHPPTPAPAPVAMAAATPVAPAPSLSEYAEAEIRALKERLNKSEEQLRLMQGQSRAIRTLSAELVKARQEISDLAPRITSMDAENRELRRVQAEQLAALEAKLHSIRNLEPNHPFLLVEQHLARRMAAK